MTVNLAATPLFKTTHWEPMHYHEALDERGRALRQYEELVEMLKIRNVKVLS